MRNPIHLIYQRCGMLLTKLYILGFPLRLDDIPDSYVGRCVYSEVFTKIEQDVIIVARHEEVGALYRRLK